MSTLNYVLINNNKKNSDMLVPYVIIKASKTLPDLLILYPCELFYVEFVRIIDQAHGTLQFYFLPLIEKSKGPSLY